ncbi:MAG TPA: SRPBCC domain-containing protein [Thermoleophilaceae bacterium]|nr:SRPBCC domain-containing protein [Thermoleophilaceae bacterium]
MKLEQSFQVEAPIERVWQALIDPERVAPCLPGADITPGSEDGTYRGDFTVKLGPTTASYRGELEMESVDEAARRVVMRASGQDKRGQGSAKATIESVLRSDGAATTVDVVTEFTITGRLARFGRGGMIQDVSNRLLRDFSACLAEMIEHGGAPEEATSAAQATESGAAAPALTPEPGGPAGAAGTAPGGAPSPPAAAGQPQATPPRATSPAATRPTPARASAKPVKGLSLLLSVLFERLKRLLRRS